MTDRLLLQQAREERLVVLSGRQRALARQLALGASAAPLRIRVPRIGAEWLEEELAAMVIEAVGIPAAPRHDRDSLLDAAGDALCSAAVACVEIADLDEVLRRDRSSLLARWVDATETTVFVVSAGHEDEAHDHAAESAKPTPEEAAILGALAVAPLPLPIRALNVALGFQVAEQVLRLSRRGLVTTSWVGGDLLVALVAADSVMNGAADSEAIRGAIRHIFAKMHVAGRPASAAAAAYCARHRTLLRWAYDIERGLRASTTTLFALPLLTAMGPLGPLTSMIELTAEALLLSPPAELAGRLHVQRALLLRAAGRGEQAASELEHATADGCPTWSAAMSGEAALTLELLATPELGRPALRERALSLRARLDHAVPLELAIDAHARAAAQWTNGTAGAALALALNAMSAYAESGDDAGQLEMLSHAAVYAVGAQNPLALDLCEDLERSARRYERGDLSARAHGLRGCALLDAGSLEGACSELSAAIASYERAGFRHFERWQRAHRGFARAAAGDLVGAARDFDDFVAMTEMMRGSSIVGVLAGAVLGSAAGLSRLPSLAGVPDYLTRHAEIVSQTLASPSERVARASSLAAAGPTVPGYFAFEVRALERLLSSDATVARKPKRRRLRMAADASWFELDGRPRVALSRSRTMRRALAAMVDTHAARGSLSTGQLFAAAWPGEKASAASSANRVHVTICRLRALGLKDVVVYSGTGWQLDEELEIVRG